MRKTVFVMLTMALVPFGAFAVDGVVLINQSTVMAAGNFPYPISVAGSYKLSGNLVVPGNSVNGIQITASNVTLDLNGFSITESSLNPGNGGFAMVLTIGAVTGVTLRNGTISAISARQINTNSASGTVFEDLTLLGGGNCLLGSLVIVRRVSYPNGFINITCPALVVDSLSGGFVRNQIVSTACTFGFVSGQVI